MQQKLIYNCLYKYSHKKLERLLTCETFGFLFKTYVQTEAFQFMMEQDETLKKNKDAYQQACNYFVKVIDDFN